MSSIIPTHQYPGNTTVIHDSSSKVSGKKKTKSSNSKKNK